MYIALEAGIGLGALISATIYQNQTINFSKAFLVASFLSVLAFVLLYTWRKQQIRKITTPNFELISE